MKKLLSLLLALTMVISLATIGLAADEDKKDSEASIELIKGAFEVIDPENPEVPYNPADPDPDHPDNPDGPLYPLSGKGVGMYFGKRQITGRTISYPAVTDETNAVEKPVGVMVKDARGTETAKWELKVAITKFSAGGKETLKGAYIDLVADGTEGLSSSIDNKAIKSTLEGANGGLTGGDTATLTTPGEAQTIFESHANGSKGTWGGLWDADINITGGTETVATHSATISWTLATTA